MRLGGHVPLSMLAGEVVHSLLVLLYPTEQAVLIDRLPGSL